MKTIYTPREELVCGKLDTLEDLLRDIGEQAIPCLYLTADIRRDAQRMEQKLISRKEEVARIESEVLATPSAGAVPDETGWLIENGGQFEELRYRFMDNDAGGVIGWTPDHAKALRFARRADAEQFCYHDEDAWRVVEHMWCDTTFPIDGRGKGEGEVAFIDPPEAMTPENIAKIEAALAKFKASRDEPPKPQPDFDTRTRYSATSPNQAQEG
jgi:hypothetical protein